MRAAHQEDSKAASEEDNTRDCIQKTHQPVEEQTSINGGSTQHLLLEKSSGVTSHSFAPDAATTQDSELLKDCGNLQNCAVVLVVCL